MTNEERRMLLSQARMNARDFAAKATAHYNATGEDGPEVNIAQMFALVALAMKDGSPEHDGVIDTLITR